jgi:putative hydrolase of the HAD superfamily
VRLPHVVWDMGGIMYRYFTEVLHDRGVQEGWPLDGIPLGPTGETPDPDYVRMQEGEIDEPAFVAIVAARLLSAGVDGNPIDEIDWPRYERTATWNAIRRIHRAGHRQALLTNDASKWLGPRWWESWKPAGWFEALVDVTTVGQRKPAAAPYLAAARALEAEPSDCLFVDDMPVNCRGAEAVGMASLWFDVTAPDASIRRLYETLSL